MSGREMIMDIRTGHVRPGVAQSPLLSSAASGWRGFHLEKHNLKSLDLEDVCCLNHLVVLQKHRPVTLEWSEKAQYRQEQIQPGQISLFPSYFPHSLRILQRCEFLTVSLEPRFLTCAAAEYGALNGVDLRPVLGKDDPLVREILFSLKVEAERGHVEDELYAESLACMLAMHLLRAYSANPLPARRHPGGLTKKQLRQAIDFVQDELPENISLSQLASVVQLSPFHFARQFKRSTGLSPHEYVTRCRVERARTLLLRPSPNIAEVAVRVGFCDQSHLARHFKQRYGLTPSAFAQSRLPRKNIR